MEEKYVEIPVSVELKKELEDIIKKEIEKLETQLKALKENNFDAVLKYLLENYEQIFI
jgi:hypothetical protein